MNKEIRSALLCYVDLFVRAAELDRDMVDGFLDGYYALRNLAESEDAPTATEATKEPRQKGPQDPASFRGPAAGKYKREVRDRIEELREKGVSIQTIALSAGVGVGAITDILQAAKVDYEIYCRVGRALINFN